MDLWIYINVIYVKMCKNNPLCNGKIDNPRKYNINILFKINITV